MMTHWLKVEFDESGSINVRAFCAAPYGPEGKERDATVHRDVALSAEDAAALTKTLSGVVEANRQALERDARKARAACELTAELRNEFEDADEEADAAEETAVG